jgi:hypothetical protein
MSAQGEGLVQQMPRTSQVPEIPMVHGWPVRGTGSPVSVWQEP